MRSEYEVCLATSAKQVPSWADWIHEVKHDGYSGERRVRLLSRNGTDWRARYPLIAESALNNRHKHFVNDGEAVVLGVDGLSYFSREASTAGDI
jgi:ATP-dependent DNA ligase